MKYQNFKSDFTSVHTFYRQEGDEKKQIAVPEHVRLTFFTAERCGCITVERNGVNMTSCSLSEDGMTLKARVPLSKKSLGTGELFCEISEITTDAEFPDKERIEVTPIRLGVTLWPGKSDDAAEVQSELVLGIISKEVTAVITSCKEATAAANSAANEASSAALEAKTAAEAVSGDISRIQTTLGHYSPRSDIALTAKETGMAISSDGVKVSKAGWAIAEFTAEKGVEYLFKPGTVDGGVCIFSQKITRRETRSIDYAYTYDEDGKVKTATATYNGKTHTYTYTYTETGPGDSKIETVTIKDETGATVTALPYRYETTVGTYLPMVRLNADAELPTDGYCRLMSHFQGNASLTVVVSYKVDSADLTMKAVKDGVFASIATQLGNLSKNIASTQEALSANETATLENRADLDRTMSRIASPDDRALPLLCGQPPILFGAGTPKETVVPDNWNQYDPATGEGYNWNGKPSAIGQQYVDTTAASGGRYIAARNGEWDLKWINC